MASYLEAVQVAVGDEEQKAETRSKVERFLSADGVGPKLQQLLIEKQSKEDNWVFVAPNFVQDVADFVSAILDYKELIDR
jgi:hypothetical protein